MLGAVRRALLCLIMFFDFYCLKSGYKYLHAVTFNSNVSSSLRWKSVFFFLLLLSVSLSKLFSLLFISFFLTQSHTLFTPYALFCWAHTLSPSLSVLLELPVCGSLRIFRVCVCFFRSFLLLYLYTTFCSHACNSQWKKQWPAFNEHEGWTIKIYEKKNDKNTTNKKTGTKRIVSTITHDCSLCWFSALCFRFYVRAAFSLSLYLFPTRETVHLFDVFNGAAFYSLNLLYNAAASAAAVKLVDHLQNEKRRRINETN